MLRRLFRWTNPVNWLKLLLSNTVVAGQARHILQFGTLILVSKYGLDPAAGDQWVADTMKLLPAIIAMATSALSKAQSESEIPDPPMIRAGGWVEERGPLTFGWEDALPKK